MKSGALSVPDRLARIRALLSGLSGPHGNGELRAWANPGTAEGVPLEVFRLVRGLDAGGGLDEPFEPPESPDDLAGRLTEIDEAGALRRLVRIASVTLAYRTPGRYDEAKAGEVFRALARLLGYGARWWTNTDLCGWDPVTRHVMDAVVVGAGGGVVVTVLAFDED
ncbi:hypothetical protein [Bailinhaonella thermotolerans]|uniref:Uncharacterized protein n=1 Tax=Bailinhaonella thermotolerans TaxID=1070861 RepID=A0A3A4BNG1_9ACTN|nr:hypothetical protein [Bailinhaonella thermotolerans]RJL32584.1 hypothetical protein D5H75_13775 [Bailinhaonella thermotolerans]